MAMYIFVFLHVNAIYTRSRRHGIESNGGLRLVQAWIGHPVRPIPAFPHAGGKELQPQPCGAIEN